MLSVNHQNQFPAATISFNLLSNAALGSAVSTVDNAVRKLHLPPGISGSFQGTAQAFQASLAGEPLLILAALFTVYIVLGILYESLIHPVTILSTLPSAGCGALLALIDYAHRFNHHRADRHYFINWYRQEKCHHDDRLCLKC